MLTFGGEGPSFMDLFTGGAGANPALGSMIAQNPEVVAQHLAAQGVPPPPPLSSLEGAEGSIPGYRFFSPAAAATPPLNNGPMPSPRRFEDIGMASEGGVPAEVPAPAPVPSVPDAGPYGGSPETNPNLRPQQGARGAAPADLLRALQGLKAPPAPEVQRLSSPAPPRPTSSRVKDNALMQALMTALQGGGGNDVKPLFLGTALGGRR